MNFKQIFTKLKFMLSNKNLKKLALAIGVILTTILLTIIVSDKEKFKILLFIVFCSFAVIGVFLLIFLIYKLWKQEDISISGKIDLQKMSALGDFAGGFVGIFFTIATVSLVWLTYQEQQEELAETKQQIQIQQFDATFFSLLNTLNQSVENMDLRIMKKDDNGELIEDNVRTGRDCFHNLTRTIHTKIRHAAHHHSKNISIEKAPKKTVSDNSSDLQPYLGMLSVIIKHIYKYENVIDTDFYTSTLKANLSGYEIVILNYVMFTDVFNSGTKALVCKYDLLSNIDVDKLDNKSNVYVCP